MSQVVVLSIQLSWETTSLPTPLLMPRAINLTLGAQGQCGGYSSPAHSGCSQQGDQEVEFDSSNGDEFPYVTSKGHRWSWDHGPLMDW